MQDKYKSWNPIQMYVGFLVLVLVKKRQSQWGKPG